MKDTFVGQETDAKVQQEGLEMGVIRAKGKNVSGGQFMEDIISKRKCLHFHNIILQICLFTLALKVNVLVAQLCPCVAHQALLSMDFSRQG